MKNTVYFLSPGQDRSSIAEGWAGRLDMSGWAFKSAGLTRKNRKKSLSTLAMKEYSIDIDTLRRDPIQIDELAGASLIVTIYDEELDDAIKVPEEWEEKVIHWNLPNPQKRSTSDLEEWVFFQEICDEIAMKVRDLESLLPSIRMN
ncbi:hypothetical protein [Rossellomorea marisflavi]|uniref:hypothetical protein n=2 Tax=Rossellomorea marisflavi TaxID=189381 RepID=UPI0035167AAB